MAKNIEILLTAEGLAHSVDPKHAKPGTPVELTNLKFDRLGRLVGRQGFGNKSAAYSSYHCVRLLKSGQKNLALMAPSNEESDEYASWTRTEPEVWLRNEEGDWGAISESSNFAFGRLPAVASVSRLKLWPDKNVAAHSCAVGRVKTSGDWVGPPVLMSVIQEASTNSMWVRYFTLDGVMLAELAPVFNRANPRVFWDWDLNRFLLVATPSSYTGTDPIYVYAFATDDTTPNIVTPATLNNQAYNGPLDVAYPRSGDYFAIALGTQYTGSPTGAILYFVSKATPTSVADFETLATSAVTSVALSENFDLCAFSLVSTGHTWVAPLTGTAPDMTKGTDVDLGVGTLVSIGGHSLATHRNVYVHGYTNPDAAIRQYGLQVKRFPVAGGSVTATAELLGIGLAGAPIVEEHGSGVGIWRDLLPIHCGLVAEPATTDINAMQSHHALMSVSARSSSQLVRGFLAANLLPDEQAKLFEVDDANQFVVRGAKYLGEHFVPVTERTAFDTRSKGICYRYKLNGPDMGLGCLETETGAIVLSGGVLGTMSQAGEVAEHVPVQYPVLQASVGAALVGRSGTFYYTACYCYTDRYGRIARGPMSIPVSDVAVAHETDVAYTLTDLTRYGLRLNIELYRSDDGDLYNLMTTISGSSATGIYEDDDLAGAFEANQAPYTESGEPSHFCPPFSTAVILHNNRLFSVTGQRIYFTHQFEAGEVPQWTAVGYFECAEDVTGLCTQAGQLLLFGERNIWYVSGDGPNRLMQGEFDAPRILVPGLGAPRSLGGHRAICPVGGVVWFRSHRSIERMAAGAEPEPIGNQIKDILAAAPFVHDVAHVPGQYSVYWTLGVEAYEENDSGTLERTVVRFDYLHQVWSTYEGLWTGGAGPLGSTDSLLLVGVDSFYEVEGRTPEQTPLGIWEELPGWWRDQYTATPTDSDIIATIEFSPIRPFGAGGRGWIRHLQILGECRHPGELLLTVEDDHTRYLTSVTRSWTEPGEYEFRVMGYTSCWAAVSGSGGGAGAARGSSAGGPGGKGGLTTGTLTVVHGEALTIVVGEAGATSTDAGEGGGGGGTSGIWRGATPLVIGGSGGGGGGGGQSAVGARSNGGDGGGSTGETGGTTAWIPETGVTTAVDCDVTSDGGMAIVAYRNARIMVWNHGAWSEEQPLGDVDAYWGSCAISDDGESMLVAISGASGRLYAKSATEAWHEERPAGDTNQDWRAVALSADGTKRLAIAATGRVWYDDGTGWNDEQPSGDTNEAWYCASMSSDGSVILCGESPGRLWLKTGGSWAETRPNGDADFSWHCVAVSASGTRYMAGAYGSRLWYWGGSSWTEQTPVGAANYNWQSCALDGTGTKRLAGGSTARLWYYNGTTWAETRPAGVTNQIWSGVAFDYDGNTQLAAALNTGFYWQQVGGTGGSASVAGQGVAGGEDAVLVAGGDGGGDTLAGYGASGGDGFGAGDGGAGGAATSWGGGGGGGAGYYGGGGGGANYHSGHGGGGGSGYFAGTGTIQRGMGSAAESDGRIDITYSATSYSVPFAMTVDDYDAGYLEIGHKFWHPWTGSMKLTITLTQDPDYEGRFPELNALSLEVEPVAGGKKLRMSKEF